MGTDLVPRSCFQSRALLPPGAALLCPAKGAAAAGPFMVRAAPRVGARLAAFGVRRWRADRGGGEPLSGGTEPSGVLRLLAPWFPPSSWFTATSGTATIGMATSGLAVSAPGSNPSRWSTGSCRALSWPSAKSWRWVRHAPHPVGGAARACEVGPGSGLRLQLIDSPNTVSAGCTGNEQLISV